MSRRQKVWKYAAGKRPHRVTVRERTVGDCVRVQAGGIRRSLGYVVRDEKGKLIPDAVERAEQYADAQALKLRKGSDHLLTGRVTLGQVIRTYLKKRTPKKGAATTRQADECRAKLWLSQLGEDKDPVGIRLSEWETVIEQRRSGAIDARGREVPREQRKPVGNRTVEVDCRWLNAVFNWAVRWQTEATGHFLLSTNPVRGMEIPVEKNPSRPIISEDRYQMMRSFSDGILMEIRWHGEREKHRSYLSELLDIANGTGRRISSILALRFSDLSLTRGEHCPHGSITWRAEEDKEGIEWKDVPIDAGVRSALDRILRERPGLGDTLLFPSPKDRQKPCEKRLPNEWFRRCEKDVMKEHGGFQPMAPNRTFHGFRAKFATETKHLPDIDRAAVGGWKNTDTLRQVYDQADSKTKLLVVTERRVLREAL